jgi:tol-pal system protein YbgF
VVFRALMVSSALGAGACGASASQQVRGASDTRSPQDAARALVRLQETADAQSARIAELETRLALVEAEARGFREQAPAAQRPVETVRIGEDRRGPDARGGERVPVVRLHEQERRAPIDEGPVALPDVPLGVSARIPVVPLPEERSAKAAPTLTAASPDAAKLRDRYRVALRAVQERRYAEAKGALTALLDDRPGGALAEGASYWLGEVHYAERRYGEALRQFESLLALHPKGSKRADAMLKAGLCLRRLGDDERAKRYFHQVRQEHPTSEAARMASREGAS